MAITTTLRMHYDVEAVDPSRKIPKDEFDVLLAVMPSSLLQDEMTNFVEDVRAGRPVVIFEDPVPLFMSRMVGGGRRMLVGAPKLPKPTPGGGGMMGMMGGGRQQAPPKADNGKASSLLDILQIAWNTMKLCGINLTPISNSTLVVNLFSSPMKVATATNRSAINRRSPRACKNFCSPTRDVFNSVKTWITDEHLLHYSPVAFAPPHSSGKTLPANHSIPQLSHRQRW